MSKELEVSEELEALEKLTNYKCSCMSEKIECKKIIEVALKELAVKREVIGDILTGDEEKKLKALNEICALYSKWLGYKIGDYEFFTLLNDILDKYDLLKDLLREVLL